MSEEAAGFERMELERPILSVDVAVFSVADRKPRVLLHRREKEPFAGAPALPGVAVRVDETLEAAARRALRERSGLSPDFLSGMFLEQLAAFDGLYRDPRGRTVSVAFLGIAPERPDGGPFLWRSTGDGEIDLPFDHDRIVETGLDRLRGKLRYTTIARAFLPETFRIDDLQDVYEAILGRKLNRANFRNKLLKLGLIEQVKVLNEAVGKKGGRPPHLYRFAGGRVETVDRDFL